MIIFSAGRRPAANAVPWLRNFQGSQSISSTHLMCIFLRHSNASKLQNAALAPAPAIRPAVLPTMHKFHIQVGFSAHTIRTNHRTLFLRNYRLFNRVGGTFILKWRLHVKRLQGNQRRIQGSQGCIKEADKYASRERHWQTWWTLHQDVTNRV